METPIIQRIIRSAEDLTALERSQLNHLLDEAFSHDDFGRAYQWAKSDWRLLLETQGEFVSHAGIVERTVTVEGLLVRVGGIGAVATAPRWQRRGLARQLLERAAGFMRSELRVDFGLLICGDDLIPYYGRLGWRVTPGPLWADQPQGKVKMPTAIMALSLTGLPWPSGAIDLCGLPW
jgi:aminoglycoside 2'-N-acetyltransferase I